MTPSDHSSEMPADQRSEACATPRPDSWRLELGAWSTLQASAAPIRLEVFVHEQHVPLAEELDTLDEVCVHAVVFDAGAVRWQRVVCFLMVISAAWPCSKLRVGRA